VAVTPVVEREIAVGQSFVGTLMPVKKAIIGSAVDGRVIEFPRNAGDRVESGEKLAQLLTDTIMLEWKTAQSELAYRQAQLDELKNGTRLEEKEQARARMKGAAANMKYQQARRARIEASFAANRAVSEEERDAAVSTAIAAEQAYLEALQASQMADAGPRKEQIAQAQAQVDMQQATVNRLKDQMDKHTIISRFAGYITAEHTEIGQWVKQGDPVAEVVALDEVEIIAQVVEQYVPYSRVGTAVPVEIPALAGRPPFAGQVTAIVPQADVQARTFPVQVRVKNELVDGQPLLKAGMYARVSLPTGKRQVGMLVPKDALVLGGAQPRVFVVEGAADGKQGKSRPVSVKLGSATGNHIEVSGDLKPGQWIVVRGNEGLPPNEQQVLIDRVIPPEPAANSALSRSDQP
jgi:RND family efflux transporter MFP subunit